MTRRLSFRRRVALLTSLAVAVAILTASSAIYLLLSHNLHAGIDRTLNDATVRVMTVRRQVDPSSPLQTTPSAGASVGGETGAGGAASGGTSSSSRVDVAPSALSVIVQSDGIGGISPIAQAVPAPGSPDEALPSFAGSGADPVTIPITAEVRRVAAGQAGAFFRTTTVDGTRLRVLTARMDGGTVQIARALTENDRTLANLRLVLGGVVLLGALIAGLLGLLVARGVLGPVARLTRTAEDVSETLDLSHRIDESAGDELGRLAASFNAMLAALDESREAQRQLVADASHELRTPITSVRANIELLVKRPGIPDDERRTMLENASRQLQELTVLVGDLVDLARPSDGPTDDEPERLRLDLLTAEAVDRARLHAGEVELVTTIAPTEVVGSRARLHRAISNLLDNAIKWSPPGGHVEIAVAGGVVTVRDHGPGIAADDLPHVFDRFWRTADARGLPGSGLGLAIVRQVAEAHGGTAEVARADAQPGAGVAERGTVVRLRLPVAPSQPEQERTTVSASSSQAPS